MGMLEDITGTLGGVLGSNSGENSNLVNTAFKVLMGKFGGLGGVINSFNNNGLGDTISSWVSTGANKPITENELRKGLGEDNLQEIANQAGIPQEQAASKLTDILPNLIDKLTPNGQVPDGNLLNKGFDFLKRSL